MQEGQAKKKMKLSQKGKQPERVSPAVNSLEPEEDAKRQQLMKSMAHLWLQQEVHELECRSGFNDDFGGGGVGLLRGLAHYSPYLVVDHLALAQNLQLVRNTVSSHRFVVVVPLVVLQRLDDVKKASAGARNAIRYLEKQFKVGNRWLRPQRAGETKAVDLGDDKPRGRAAREYAKVLECCKHFTEGESVTGKHQVTLLTAEEEREEEEEVLFVGRKMAEAQGKSESERRK